MEKFPHLEAVPENISKWKTGRNGDIDAAMQLGLKPEEDLDDKYIAAPEPEFIFRHDLRKMQEIPQISLLTRHFVSGNRNYRGLRILTVADSFWGYISPFMVPLASEEIYAFYGSGKDFVFEFSSGQSFPEDLSKYALVVHCGGCMLKNREVLRRMRKAISQNVPFTNYGVLLNRVLGA